MLFPRFRYLAFAAVLLAIAPQAAFAQDESSAEGASEDPIVARVNGDPIRLSDVEEVAKSLGQNYEENFMLLFPRLLERMIDLELVTQAAGEEGLENDPEVEARMAELREQVIRDVYLQRIVDEAVSEEKVRMAYDVYVEENPPQEEIRASHILLETKEDAMEVIAELDAGADFAELAKERSTGPSGEKGGDLGYFDHGTMVPSFSDAAFALETGSYTQEPVESQFGWHVIKVVDRREGSVESFDAKREELRQQLERAAVEGLLDDLREGGEVKMYGLDGEQAAGMESEDGEEMESGDEDSMEAEDDEMMSEEEEAQE